MNSPIWKLPVFAAFAGFFTTPVRSTDFVPSHLKPSVIVDTGAEPMAPGKFTPDWTSLRQYETPEWFRDAKFGIWAHWGPQCEPEAGDWYAKLMYVEGNPKYRFHVGKYGHPSRFGFKDVIHQWKADRWDPKRLVGFFKRAGAQYFFAMANHHDNFDLWDSKYQQWNSLHLGPEKDIVAGWATAARKAGLPFGLSVHASHAWTWYEPSQGADKTGPFAGVPYDGKLTKADGRGQWWEGLDPQDLYAQHHSLSSPKESGSQWQWANGASIPDQAYCEKFYNRTIDLINRFQPDLLYFDDTALPLWPVSDAGLKIAAHYYNQNIQANGGRLTAVLFGKWLTDDQKSAMTLDIERNVSGSIEPIPWQSDTCLGDWHYARKFFTDGNYRSAAGVIRMLVDIVSKNGNLLLSVPVRADGSLDAKEENILAEIAVWMDVNRESLLGTRPWKIFGERADGAPRKSNGEFSAEDIRFATKGEILYVTALGFPDAPLRIGSLGEKAGLLDRPIASIEQLGGGVVRWNQDDNRLEIEPRPTVSQAAVVFKIAFQ